MVGCLGGSMSPLLNSVEAEALWQRFMDHLAKADPIGPREDPIQPHKSFLGSVEKYRAIFINAVIDSAADVDGTPSKTRAGVP